MVKERSSGKLTACDVWENIARADLGFSTSFIEVGCSGSCIVSRCDAGSPDVCLHQPGCEAVLGWALQLWPGHSPYFPGTDVQPSYPVCRGWKRNENTTHKVYENYFKCAGPFFWLKLSNLLRKTKGRIHVHRQTVNCLTGF